MFFFLIYTLSRSSLCSQIYNKKSIFCFCLPLTQCYCAFLTNSVYLALTTATKYISFVFLFAFAKRRKRKEKKKKTTFISFTLLCVLFHFVSIYVCVCFYSKILSFQLIACLLCFLCCLLYLFCLSLFLLL